MATRYVKLQFELTDFDEDENASRVITFEGHAGFQTWRQTVCNNGAPSDREAALLAQLARTLDELAVTT